MRMKRDDLPNVVIITCGRTGSGLLVRMAEQIGWNVGHVHPVFGEPMGLADTQWQYLHGNASRPALENHIRRHLQSLPAPWLVKDSRICECWEIWRPILAEYKATLILSERDPEKVRASWERQGWDTRLLARRREQAVAAFRDWDGPRLRLRHEDVCAAAGLAR